MYKILGLLLFAVFVAGCGKQEPTPQPNPSSKASPVNQQAQKAGDMRGSVLFVVNATKGTIEGGDDLTITMELQEHSNFWFTDHPKRLAGPLFAIKFFENWYTFFKNDPPNAVLVTDSARGESALPVTLQTPTLRGSTVSFRATLLDKIPESIGLKGHKASSDAPQRFAHASLFIDNLNPFQEVILQSCLDSKAGMPDAPPDEIEQACYAIAIESRSSQ